MKVAVLSQGADREEHVVAVFDAERFTKEMGRLFLSGQDTRLEFFEVNAPFAFSARIAWDLREVPE